MTFWQLVRTDSGEYVFRPYVTIYDGMVEIELHGKMAEPYRR
jgi:hypothetical protein